MERVEGSLDIYLEQHKKQYEEYLNFIESEKSKGEGISEEVRNFLFLQIKTWGNNYKFSEEAETKRYSSGRKFVPFDKMSFFTSYKKTETTASIDMISFCTQEIDSYARSYRILKVNNEDSDLINLVLGEKTQMIEVFEFKPDKI